uniref:Oligodendrocyte myelin glycoprotein a n=1 Tax=Sinocyclocheilus anshuiensis TaxID=1608454 RepID=A0A671SSE7_9TELE
MPVCAAMSCLLWLWFTCTYVHAECPSVCSCSESHRTVDCSRRGVRHLPVGLQRNIQSLNLTHNRLSDLDHHLSSLTHLRILDISYKRLLHFPASLPRALWEINVSGNHLRVLNRDDTAYQWNLRVLDLSVNKLERVVFINNTLSNLKALNLSHKFWTVPTNMPQNLEVVDLSHNTLVQILPRSMNRLHSLARFYLHANRFTTVSEGTFEHLQSLKLITLGDNPWASEETANISHLLVWTKHTSARVLGCPCHTWHTCGEAHLSSTGSWHFGTYTQSPHVFGTEETKHLETLLLLITVINSCQITQLCRHIQFKIRFIYIWKSFVVNTATQASLPIVTMIPHEKQTNNLLNKRKSCQHDLSITDPPF